LINSPKHKINAAPKAKSDIQEVLSCARQVHLKGDYQALQIVLEEVTEEHLKIGSFLQRYELNWFFAESYFYLQDNKKSFFHAKEGLELANLLSPKEQAKSHYQIARCYGELGAMQNCLDHALLAFELDDEDDPKIYNAIGVTYYRRKNYNEAQQWFERGLSACTQHDAEEDLRMKAILNVNIAGLYFARDDYLKSLDYIQIAHSALPKSQESYLLTIYYEFVKIHLKLNDVNEAENYFQKAVALEDSLELSDNVHRYLNYSTLLEVKGNYARAEEVLLEGIEHFEKNNLSVWLGRAYEQLINLYKKQDKLKQALETFEKRFTVTVKQLNHDFDRQTNVLLANAKNDLIRQEREFYRKQSQILSENLTEAQFQAHTDALTGIHNRTYFDYISKVMFSSAVNLQQPLSILMIDIDYFKKVNDDFGHLVGDTVLKIVATLMKDNLRKEDILARYGGEEFTVLLPNTVEAMALVVAEKMRCEIESYNWGEVVTGLAVTISIGVCQDDESLNTSINIADKRLYEAKELGRNRSVGS